MNQPVNRDQLDIRLANGEIKVDEYRTTIREGKLSDSSPDRINKPDEKALVENLKNGKLEGANLSSINWKNVGMAGAHFAGANLKKAKLSKQDLRGVDLAGANLAGANLSGADLSEANLAGANLTGANLKGATLDNVKLFGAELVRARAISSEWQNVDARRANLSQADLVGAKLTNVSLADAQLVEADFSDAHLMKLDMSRADFGRSNMQNAEVKESVFIEFNSEVGSFDGTDFIDCDFRRAKLLQANFSECRLTNVKFGEADLSKAIFTLSEHEAVDLKGATLTGSIFKSLVGYKEEELQAMAARGAKVNKFLMRRLGRLILQSTAAKIITLVVVLSMAAGIYYYIKTPAYWSFDKLTAEARNSAGSQEFERAETLYRVAVKKYADSPERMFSTRLELGNVLISLKKFNNAEEQYNFLIENYAADTEVIYAEIGLADAKRLQGKYQEAEQILLKVTEQYKDSLEVIDAWAKLAQLAYLQGQIERGNEIYQKIISLPVIDRRTVREIQSRLAEVLRNNKNKKQAAAIYLDIIENAKTAEQSQNAYVNYTNMLLDSQKYDEAVNLIEKVETKFPDQKEFVANLKIQLYARLLDSRQYLNIAIKELKKIETDLPNSDSAFRALMALAQYYRNGKGMDEAEAIYLKLQKQPKLSDDFRYEVIMSYAELQTFRGNTKEAIKLVKDLPNMADDPGRKLSASSIYAEALAADNRYEDALKVLRKVRRKLAGNKQAETITYYSEAGIHRRFGHYKEAIQNYRQALKVAEQPGQVFQAYMEILTTYNAMQAKAERDKVLQEMQKRFKNNAKFAGDVDYQIAQDLIQQGKTKEAIAIIAPLTDNPKDRLAIDAIWTLASIYSNDKREKELIELRDKFLARFPDNRQGVTQINNALASMYQAMGQYEKAAEIYDLIATEGSENNQSQALLSLLQIYIDQGKDEQAQAVFRKITEDPFMDVGIAARANSLWAGYLCKIGKDREARDLYQKMLGQYEGTQSEINVLFELANYHMRDAQWKEAERIYQTILVKAPKLKQADAGAIALQRLAELSLMRNDAQSAQKYLDQVVQVKGGMDREFWIEQMKMRILLLNKQTDEAIAAFERIYQQFKQRRSEIEGAVSPLISQLVQSKQYPRAEKIYLLIIGNTSDNMVKANALIGLANIYFEMNQEKKGQQTIEQARALLPEQSPQRLQVERDIANRLLQRGENEAALAIFRNLLKFSVQPQDKVHTLIQIGEVYQRLGKVDEAIKINRQLLEEFRDSANVRERVLNNLANLAAEQGRNKEAAKYYRQIIEESRDLEARLNAINGLVGIYLQRQEYSKALEQCNALEKMKLNDKLMFKVQHKKAEVYRQMNRRQQALDIYKKLLKQVDNPRDKGQLLLAVGMIYMESEKPKESRKICEQILADKQFDPSVHLSAKRQLADLFQRMNKTDKAIALWREIAQESTDTGTRIGALSNIAQIYLSQEKFNEAAKIFENLLADKTVQDPQQQFEAYRGLGDIYNASQKHDQAIQAYLQARELGGDPNQYAALDISLAEIYVKVERYSEALAAFQKLLKQPSVDPNIIISAYNGIAEVYRRQNNVKKVLESYQTIIDKYADQPDLVINTYFTLSNFYGSIGNEKQAIRQNELIVEKFPDHPQAGWAQVAIAQHLANTGQNDKAEKMVRAALKKYAGNADLEESLNNILAGIKASKEQK